MPVLASAEAKLVDTQTFARSITLGRASDTYVTREDWRDTLRAMDGTALSESYADISAQEKGLYYEVANENGVNQTGLMDAAGTLLIPMTYSDFTYVGNGWVVAVTLEETTDEKSDYRAMFGGGHYNVVRGDIYYGAQKMAEMNREETTGASMEVYGAYLFVRLDKSSGFYLKTDGTRTEFTGESFSRGEYEEIYKQGVYHHPTAQFAFVPECALTADEVSRSVWYDAKTGNFLDLQGNVLREAVQDGKPLYDSVRYYGGDYMLTKKDRLSGIVDMTGQEIVPPMYDTLGGDYAGLLFEGGYQAALALADIPLLEDYCVEMPTLGSDDAAVHALLSRADRPTAIVVSDDLLGMTLGRACLAHGLSIPKDISIISFNNSLFAKLTSPRLTSVDLNSFQLGIEAASQLISHVERPELMATKSIIPHRIVERESCRDL